jgi:hypothetical protein
LLSAVPKLVPTGLELRPEDFERFKKLSQELDKFNEAMKLFRKRGKEKTGVVEDSDDNEI